MYQLCRPSGEPEPAHPIDSRAGCQCTHVHGLKFQSIQCPNGIIGPVRGPYSCRLSDAAVFDLSLVVVEISEHFALNDKTRVGHGGHGLAPNFLLYGDPEYAISDVVISAFPQPVGSEHLTKQEREFNRRMSTVRAPVEWSFKLITSTWRALQIPSGPKVGRSRLPAGMAYLVAVDLTNLRTILRRGNQISKFFGMAPPTVESYIAPRAYIGQAFPVGDGSVDDMANPGGPGGESARHPEEAAEDNSDDGADDVDVL